MKRGVMVASMSVGVGDVATKIDQFIVEIDSRWSRHQQSCRWSRVVAVEDQGREGGAYAL